MRKIFQGQLWTQSECGGDASLDGMHVIKSCNGKGLSKMGGMIHQGSNSGYQAIDLAYHFGAKKILLIGYDMQGRGSHWFGKHSSPGLSTDTDYGALVKHFETINPDDYGIEIINCSRHTALTCFPRMNLDDALSRCVGYGAESEQAA